MKNRKISDPIYILMFIGIISVSFWGCGKEDVNIKNTVNYSSLSNWTFYPENPANDVDVFFVAPTVFSGNDSTFSMPLNDSILMYNFTGAINMEKLIYDNGNVNFYAPYYRQAGLNCYAIRGYACVSTNSNVNNAFELAYKDVEDAFYYYLSVSNKPFVLAGFSQGGEMLVELIKNIFDDPGIQGRFIAAYAIGWRLLPAEVESHAHLKQAKREDDLGVVICYSSEAEFIDSSIIVPNTTLSINPLSWTTDTTYADKHMNLGACFTDYSGVIVNEIPQLTGAFIDPGRGTLKVPDINPTDFPQVLPIFSEGEYHIYDYMFFFRNLQDNVSLRINTYLARH